MTKTKELSETVKAFCLELVLSDAKRWFKKDYPRNFVRGKDTAKHMPQKMKKELDGLFAAMNAEWDRALMTWYEARVAMYGGSVEMLPWG